MKFHSNGKQGEADSSSQVKPFKPRRKLFWLLAVLFALWIGGLLAIYFVTVYPTRYGG